MHSRSRCVASVSFPLQLQLAPFEYSRSDPPSFSSPRQLQIVRHIRLWGALLLEQALESVCEEPCGILADWSAGADPEECARRFDANPTVVALRSGEKGDIRAFLSLGEPQVLGLWRYALPEDRRRGQGKKTEPSAWELSLRENAEEEIQPPIPTCDGTWTTASYLIANEFEFSYRPSVIRHLAAHISCGLRQLAWYRVARLRYTVGRQVPPGADTSTIGVALEELGDLSAVYSAVLRTVSAADAPDAPDATNATDGTNEGEAISPFGRWLLQTAHPTFAAFLRECDSNGISSRGINPKTGPESTGPSAHPQRTWMDVQRELDNPATPPTKRATYQWLWENVWLPLLRLMQRDANIVRAATKDGQKLPKFANNTDVVEESLPDLWLLHGFLQLESRAAALWHQTVCPASAPQAPTGACLFPLCRVAFLSKNSITRPRVLALICLHRHQCTCASCGHRCKHGVGVCSHSSRRDACSTAESATCSAAGSATCSAAGSATCSDALL